MIVVVHYNIKATTMIELTKCPHAGVICKICQYPIPTNDDKYTIQRQIGRHEANTHFKPPSNATERDAFVLMYESNMKEFASKINKLRLIDAEQAKQVYFEQVGIVTKYPYCTECKKLLYRKCRVKNHAWTCNTTRCGVTSKSWTKNSPKIIPCDEFNFDDPKFFSKTFYEYLTITTTSDMPSNSNIASMNNDKKSSALHNIVEEQANQYKSAKLEKTVEEVEQNMTPNMWILHTGWDKVLCKLQYHGIFQFVNEPPSDSEQALLNSLSTTLNGIIMKVKNEIEPTHQIMSEVQRRTKYQDLNARFPFDVFKNKSTWEKYFRTVKKIVLVIIRLMEVQLLSSSDRKGIAINLPTVTFLKSQLSCYAAIKRCDLTDCPERCIIYLDFLISLVDQTIQKKMKSVPLLAVLAMISVKDEDSLADAISTTPVLAAIIGVYKVIFIAKSIKCFEDGKDSDNDDCGDDASIDEKNIGIESDTSDEETSWVKQLQLHVEKHFFVNDFGIVHTPLTVLIKIFHYGKQIARTAIAVGTIRWENDTVFYRDVSISMTNYRCCIRVGIDQLTILLLSLLRLKSCNQLPSIPFGGVIDNQTNNTADYSFISESQNQHWLKLDSYMKGLLERISNEIICDDGKTINMESLTQYEKEIEKFLKLLQVLMHVTGGQPARGTELSTLTFVNTSLMPRNITIYRGLVCFCTTYHKSQAHTGKLKRVFRFLPEPVGAALVYYLWMVLPAWQCVKGASMGAKETSPHLWSKQVATATAGSIKKTDVLSTDALLQGLSSLFRNKEINVRTYRQLSVAIARRFLNQEWAHGAGSDAEKEQFHEEFGDDADDVMICNDILDLQAAHTTETASRLYARGCHENTTTYQGNMDDFYKCSIKHHNFILNQHANAASMTTSMTTKMTTLDHLQEQLYRQRYYQTLQEERLMSLTSQNVDHSLQEFTKNSNVKFRGNLRSTIEAIIDRHPIVLQIAPTGVGKTMSYALPVYMSYLGGTTIVVIPLVSLQQNTLARFLDCQISTSIWNGKSFPNPSQIVLVSPESVVSKLFLDFINMLLNERMLDRFVLDEVHMYLTIFNSYRPNMMNISNFLRLHSVQLLCLSASVPPKYQSQLFQDLDLDEGTATVLRDPTIRKNIRYEISRIGRQKWLPLVESIVNEPRFQNERIIIYVLYIEDGETLSNALALPFYHANAPNKKMVLEQWLSSSMNRVIVATSAMGCGIDIPDIRLVLHVGTPATMIEFAQQSGRAGRDGSASYSIVMHRTSDEKRMEPEMLEYVSDVTLCRRAVLDLTMDGTIRQKCAPSESPCDCCQRWLGAFNGGEINFEELEYSDELLYTGVESVDGGLTGIEIDCVNDNANAGDTDVDLSTNLDTVDDGDDEDGNTKALSVTATNGKTVIKAPPSSNIWMDSIEKEMYVPSVRSLVRVTPGVGVSTPQNQIRTTFVSTNLSTLDREQSSKIQLKRQFVQQGLLNEQRKRLYNINSMRDDFFDHNVFERWLLEFPASHTQGCLVCRVKNNCGSCPCWPNHKVERKAIEQRQKDIGTEVNPNRHTQSGPTIPPYCSCTQPGCYVPQMICAKWEADGNGGFKKTPGGKCNHCDKVLDVILAFHDHNKTAAAFILSKADGDISKLLTTEISWGGHKMLLLHRIFFELCETYLQ